MHITLSPDQWRLQSCHLGPTVLLFFLTLGYHIPEGGLKITNKNYKSWVCLVIRAVTIWQTVMQKNRVKALYQD